MTKYENSAIARAVAALSSFDFTQQSFVDFSTHLLHDVFEILLSSTLEQLDAYTDLVANVSGSLADFEMRMVGDLEAFKAKALDYVNKVVIPSFAAATFSGPVTWPTGQVPGPTPFTFDPGAVDAARAAYAGAVADVGGQDKDFSACLTNNAGTYTMVTEHLLLLTVAKLKLDVKCAFDKLATILKIGLQKLVVTDGEVKTALTWHVHAGDSDERASSTMTQSFAQSASNWGVSHAATRSLGISGKLLGFNLGRTRGSVTTAGASGSRSMTQLRVQVVNEKKTAVTDLDVDITGSLTVHFKTETFPPIDPATGK